MVDSCIVLGISSAAIQTFHATANSDLFCIYLLLWIDFTNQLELITPKHPLLDLNGSTRSRWYLVAKSDKNSGLSQLDVS